MFGNKDIGMHTGSPWPALNYRPPRDAGPEVCILTTHYDADGMLAECGLPADAPVHQRGYAEGGHEFTPDRDFPDDE